MIVPRELIVALHLVSAVGGLVGIVTLIANSRTMTRLRNDPDRHVYDFGQDDGQTSQRNAFVVIDEMLEAGRTRRWIIVVLSLSLVAGVAANLLPR